ncbi:uncharacterized protein LOC144652216 [Oculina patagonica]
MDESLEAFLARLNLSQHLENFREARFDDLETAVTLSEEELEQSVGIVLPGHTRKLSSNFEKLRQPGSTSQSSKASLGKRKKSLQSKISFQSGKLTVELPEEPSSSDSDEPWKRFLIPHPRFPRQQFFNSILPQVYESAQPHLLGQFESCWIKEKRDRWERKQLLESLTASVTRITELSDNNYIARVRSLSVPSRPQDVSTCASAKKEVENKIKQAEDIKGKLTQQKDELFEPASTKLKSWAKEKFSYIQETLSVVTCFKSQLEAVRDEIQQTHEELAKRHKFSLASAERRRKRKQARDNAEKTKKRKLKAQRERSKDVLSKLCCTKEVLLEVAETNDEGEIKLKRPLNVEEANLPILSTLYPHSHFNALLFLQKMVSLQQALKSM